MSLDPNEVFNVMRCAYRNGVLDKFLVIQGEAIEAVIKQSGWSWGDILDRLDEAEEKTITKIEGLLNRLGPLIKYANNDRLMKLASRLLNIEVIRKMIIANMKSTILKALPGQAPPSLAERVKAMAGKAA